MIQQFLFMANAGKAFIKLPFQGPRCADFNIYGPNFLEALKQI